MRHVSALEHLAGHAVLEAVDADDTHAQAGGHHREVRGLGGFSPETGGRRDTPADESGGEAEQGNDVAPGEARGGKAVAHSSRGEDGHRRLPAEAAENERHPQAEGERGRLRRQARAREVRAPPEREVGEAEEGDAQADVSGQRGSGPVAEAPTGPAGDEAPKEGGEGGGDAEQDRQVEGENHEVAGFGEQASIESHRGQRGGQAEERPAQ